jgi:hypothetical protein
MLVILLLLLFILLILQNDSAAPNRFISIFNFFLNFLLLYLILGSATFNNDWAAYEDLFYGIKPTYDLLYVISYETFHLFNLNYENFYLVNQGLIYLLLLYFITRFFSKYVFLVVLSILVVAGPNVSILLRFHTAFAFFLVSVYFFKIRNNSLFGYLFLGLAFISHFGTIIFVGVFLTLKYFNFEKNFKYILMISFSLLLIKGILFGILNSIGIGTFGIYVEEEASLKGGILASLPYFPWMFLVYNQNRRIQQNGSFLEDLNYKFLYQVSLFPFFLIVLALFTQIILYRYVEPFIVVWVTFICYSTRYEENNRKKIIIILGVFLSIILSFYFKYFLPLSLIGISEWLIHYLQILNSNKYEIFSLDDF